jgi:hypothetical protein
VLESEGQERVAGENRDVLAEYLVVGWLSSAEIVVVHARKIVMDQRHGVDHLDGASGGHGNGLGSTDELAGGDAEHGAYTLAAG